MTKIFLSVNVTNSWSICIIGVSDTCTTFAGQATFGRMCGKEASISFNLQNTGVVTTGSVCGKYTVNNYSPL